MNFAFAKLLLVLTLLLSAFPALAQRRDLRDDPEAVAAARRHSDDVGHALGTALQARRAMQLRKYALAEALAQTALDDLTRLGGPGYAMEAHEVLAELALRQGDPREALRQADACPPYQVTQRFGMTKALALIDLGRDAEARAIVLQEVGSPDKPAPFRRGKYAWRFPVDADGSEAALKATAYMVRAEWWLEILEGREDLQAARALAPREPMLHMLAGFDAFRAKSYEAARAEYAKAASLDPRDARLQELVRMATGVVNGKIAAEKSAQDVKPTLDGKSTSSG